MGRTPRLLDSSRRRHLHQPGCGFSHSLQQSNSFFAERRMLFSGPTLRFQGCSTSPDAKRPEVDKISNSTCFMCICCAVSDACDVILRLGMRASGAMG